MSVHGGQLSVHGEQFVPGDIEKRGELTVAISKVKFSSLRFMKVPRDIDINGVESRRLVCTDIVIFCLVGKCSDWLNCLYLIVVTLYCCNLVLQ